MKKRIESFLILLACVVCTGSMRAQSQHWQCNPYDWQYDMTMYITLSINNKACDLSSYEIAAFFGDECRGVATVNTIEKDGVTVSYGYMRVRSNQPVGEDITFKVYDYTNDIELELEDTVSFVANGVEGLPSNPFVMKHVSYLRGDANGDGEIGMPDIMFVVNYILGSPAETFNSAAADANQDGEIGMPDIMFIVQYILNGKFPDE